MQLKAPKLLEDIRDAADFIEAAAREKALDDCRRDCFLRQAVDAEDQFAEARRPG